MNQATEPVSSKPLAGSCRHKWQNQKSAYILAQVCGLCHLFRYKAAITADLEYRAPIPIAKVPPSEPLQRENRCN